MAGITFGVKIEMRLFLNSIRGTSGYQRAKEKILEKIRIYKHVTLDFSNAVPSLEHFYRLIGAIYIQMGPIPFGRRISIINMSKRDKLILEAQITAIRWEQFPEELRSDSKVFYGALAPAVHYFGSLYKLSLALNVSRQTVYTWRDKEGVPLWALKNLEKISHGELNSKNIPTFSQKEKGPGGIRKKTSIDATDCQGENSDLSEESSSSS